MLATTIQLPNTTPHHQNGGTTPVKHQVLPQDPIVCRQLRLSWKPRRKKICCCAPGARHYSNTPLHGSHPPNGDAFVVLLRKEVIQPHLPVRLPCYDFVPIADPTFDSSPHKGWATGFGCYRLS